MVGESSTTRKFAFSSATIRASRCGRQQVEEALNRVQLPLRLRIEFGREDRRRSVRGEKREELVIDRRERVFLLEQFVDDYQPDDMFLDLQRNGGQRLLERYFAAFHVLIDVVALAGPGYAAHDAVTQPRRDCLDAGHDILPFRGDGLELV